MSKLAEFLEGNQKENAINIYIEVFKERFNKLVIDQANNPYQTEQISNNLKKLSNLEKELFDIHKKQRTREQKWKNKTLLAVEVNADFVP